MAFTVVYDADVLYPKTLRDLLIRIAQSGLVQAKWTRAILDEALGAVAKDHPDIPDEKLARLRELMIPSVRDCLVTGYEPLIAGLEPEAVPARRLPAARGCHRHLHGSALRGAVHQQRWPAPKAGRSPGGSPYLPALEKSILSARPRPQIRNYN